MSIIWRAEHRISFKVHCLVELCWNSVPSVLENLTGIILVRFVSSRLDYCGREKTSFQLIICRNLKVIVHFVIFSQTFLARTILKGDIFVLSKFC